MLVSKPTVMIQNHKHDTCTCSMVELSVRRVSNKIVRLTPLWRLSIWLLARQAKWESGYKSLSMSLVLFLAS
jgi:hypothetical protein